MPLSGSQFPIVAGEFSATIAEVGANLRELRHRDVNLTVPYAAEEMAPKGVGAVLVPWPNRIRGGAYTFDGQALQLALTEPARRNAIHGLGRWARWTPVAHVQNSVTLSIDLVPQPGWPFEVRVGVTYALHAEHGLAVSMTAINIGARRAPFGAGFHPYLSTQGSSFDDVRLKVPARERLIVDESAVPIGIGPVAGTAYDLRRGPRLGARRLDDAFTGLTRTDGMAAVELRIKRSGARIWFDQSFGYVQVFTPSELIAGQVGVAVEPMSCPADAFNTGTGLVVLEPGAAWTGAWGIQPL
jgi:aldose 1-epimerase